MSIGPELLAKPSVNDATVRFFQAPADGPDFFWLSLDDLLRAAGLKAEPRRLLLKDIRRDAAASVRTTLCDGSITSIAPYSVAQAILANLISTGQVPGSSMGKLSRAAGEVLDQIAGRQRPEDIRRWVAGLLKRSEAGGSA